MAKLSKKKMDELWRILKHFQRASDYIQRPDVSVTHKSKHATTVLHFTRPEPPAALRQGEPYALYEVDKQIGSDLTGLEEGIRTLTHFINGEL